MDNAEATAIILDYLPHGRTSDDRPRYEQVPLAQALGVDDFRLYELVLEDEHDISIGDEVGVRPVSPPVAEFRELTHDDLSSGAAAELAYVIEDIIDQDEARFVRVYNEAQPLTLRLHQLNLLPGIGEKLRDDIIEERRRKPFESLDEVDERISGLHNPRGVLVDRIREELETPDLKYYLFVGGGPF